MTIGVYLLLISFILGISSWLDALFDNMRIKKSYALMLLFSCLALSSFNISIMNEFYISTASMFLTFTMTAAALNYGEYSFATSLLHKAMFITATVTAAFLLPTVQLFAVMIPIALLTGAFLSKRPIFAALLCCSMPLIAYVVLLIISAYIITPYSVPNITSVQDAQVLSFVLSFIASLTVRAIKIKHALKKSQNAI